MSKIYIISFSKQGSILGDFIFKSLKDEGIEAIAYAHFRGKLSDLMKEIFKFKNKIIFIGAIGIAVRSIAAFIVGKGQDPAVVVIDELGKYVIPILSGHIGGANDFSIDISKLIDATPILTTATDINNVFAVDTWAIKNNYEIVNIENIKHISSQLLEKKDVALYSNFNIIGTLPKNIVLKDNGDIGICISLNAYEKPFKNTLNIVPKCFHIGIGARRGIEKDMLEEFFIDVLKENNIAIHSVSSISSIDLKKDEEAILYLCEKYKINFCTYSADELLKYEDKFCKSSFVKSKTGVGNVCETACFITSKFGHMLMNKKAKNGITMAIAKEIWNVNFN